MASLIPSDVGVTARAELSPSTMVFLAAMMAAFMIWKMPRKKRARAK